MGVSEDGQQKQEETDRGTGVSAGIRTRRQKVREREYICTGFGTGWRKTCENGCISDVFRTARPSTDGCRSEGTD